MPYAFPYTVIAEPLTGLMLSETSPVITTAISIGGTHLEKSACGIAFRFSAVSMVLGRTAFTFMSSFLTSSAMVSVRTSTPAFDTA